MVLDNLFGPHSANLSAALSRTTRRHGLLTENMSNVNTPGFKRQDIDFGIELERAQRTERPRRFESPAFDGTRTDQSDVRLDGSSVDLEKEVVSLAETELRYQALTDMTSRYFSGLKNVIREGR